MKSTLIVVLSLLPALAFTQDAANYVCTMNDLTRRVEIFHETGVSVPCEVHYYRDAEAPGDRQVLWRANNEEGYCETRTTEFIAKLESLGWSCATGAPAIEDMQGDDTDALAPADEDIEIPESEPRGSGEA